MEWNLDRKRPIAPQLCEQLSVQIAGGQFPPGCRLPSVRDIALSAGVNPNTVQKAYRMLEEEGLISSHSGAKSLMQLDDVKVSRVRNELLETEVGALVGALRQSGVSKAEAVALFERLWEREDDK